MKKLDITGDYPAWTHITEIICEMEMIDNRFAVQHPELASRLDPLGPILVKKFPDLDFDFCFCFRCLDKNSGWVSKARLYKLKDDPFSWAARNNIPESSRIFGFDIVTYREDFMLIKNDKAAQKQALGNELLRFLKETLPKYPKKIPTTKEKMNDILMTIEDWLAKHNWIASP